MRRTTRACSAPAPFSMTCTSTSNGSAAEEKDEVPHLDDGVDRFRGFRPGEAEDKVGRRVRCGCPAAEGLRARADRQGKARQLGGAGGGRRAEWQERPRA